MAQKKKYSQKEKLEYLLGAWDSGVAGRKLGKVDRNSVSYKAGKEAALRGHAKRAERKKSIPVTYEFGE